MPSVWFPVPSCRFTELQPDAADPQRHQVWDLPPIEPIVEEFQLFRGHCPRCGITTRAELPAGVPTGQCGPRLAAFTGLLMGHFRQSKRRTSMFLGDLLNIPCSPAWTVKIQNLVSDSIAAPYQQLRDELEKQPQLFVDESPTKEKSMKAYRSGTLRVCRRLGMRVRLCFRQQRLEICWPWCPVLWIERRK